MHRPAADRKRSAPYPYSARPFTQLIGRKGFHSSISTHVEGTVGRVMRSLRHPELISMPI